MGLGLKATVLTMALPPLPPPPPPPSFSPAEGWCFFSQGKYDAFKPRVEKVEGTRRVNACIERVFGYKGYGNHTFLIISRLFEITKRERNKLLLLSVKNLQELGSNPFPYIAPVIPRSLPGEVVRGIGAVGIAYLSLMGILSLLYSNFSLI